MDRKAIIILLVSFLVLLAWYPLTNRIFPPRPAPTNLVTRATNQLPAGAASAPLEQPDASLLSAAPLATNLPPRDESFLTLENEDARYVFTSLGGGLKRIELKNYNGVVDCSARKLPTNPPVTLNTYAPVPAFSVIEQGNTNTLAPFHLSRTGGVLRAEAPLANGLVVIKEYELSTNYLVKASIRYENRSTESVVLPERELVLGTATPMGRRDETLHLGLEWFDGEDATKITDSWFANRTLGCLPGTPRSYYRAGQSNIFWAAVHNQFFTIIAVPEAAGAEVVGRKILLPPPTREEMERDPAAFATPFGFQTALVMPDTAMPAASFVQYNFQLYAGPKEFKTLQRLPRDMDAVMGFDGFFGFFAKGLLISMNGIHALGVGYGIAIIVITVIIKLLFWPLTNASTRSMKRMAALQPQMKAIQEKYKEDPRKMNQKMMEFMKENKVSPLGGCLPVLLQIPVFFGFYTMLQSAIELRGARFLWACDLSQPDTLFHVAGFPFNPLPLLMGATMLWQARLTPPSPGMDPTQQQIMRYMPLVMVVFLYNFSAGLTLYWTVQNLLSIAQMKITYAKPEPPQGGAPVKPVKPAKPVPPKKK